MKDFRPEPLEPLIIDHADDPELANQVLHEKLNQYADKFSNHLFPTAPVELDLQLRATHSVCAEVTMADLQCNRIGVDLYFFTALRNFAITMFSIERMIVDANSFAKNRELLDLSVKYLQRLLGIDTPMTDEEMEQVDNATVNSITDQDTTGISTAMEAMMFFIIAHECTHYFFHSNEETHGENYLGLKDFQFMQFFQGEDDENDMTQPEIREQQADLYAAERGCKYMGIELTVKAAFHVLVIVSLWNPQQKEREGKLNLLSPVNRFCLVFENCIPNSKSKEVQTEYQLLQRYQLLTGYIGS